VSPPFLKKDYQPAAVTARQLHELSATHHNLFNAALDPFLRL
jgi:hypothetical protein